MKGNFKKPREGVESIGQLVRSARKNAHLSQAELANGIGVSDKAISSYEQGRSIPPFDKLKKIASVTGHPLSFFTEDNVSDTTIMAKLQTVEQQLIEIKTILEKSRK